MTSASARNSAVDALRSEVDAFVWDGLSDSKRHVLEAFLRLAATEGYGAVSMRGLARQLDIKAASLYSHFPGGKDELVAMALRWHYSRWASEVIEVVDATTGAGNFLFALIDHHVRSQLQVLENDMFDLLLATDRISGNLPRATRAEADHLIELYRELYSAALADAGAPSRLDNAPIILVSFLDAVRTWGEWNGSESDLDRIVSTAVSVVTAIVGVSIGELERR